MPCRAPALDLEQGGLSSRAGSEEATCDPPLQAHCCGCWRGGVHWPELGMRSPVALDPQATWQLQRLPLLGYTVWVNMSENVSYLEHIGDQHSLSPEPRLLSPTFLTLPGSFRCCCAYWEEEAGPRWLVLAQSAWWRARRYYLLVAACRRLPEFSADGGVFGSCTGPESAGVKAGGRGGRRRLSCGKRRSGWLGLRWRTGLRVTRHFHGYEIGHRVDTEVQLLGNLPFLGTALLSCKTQLCLHPGQEQLTFSWI
nr:uncharacterized protein LOC127489437 isoform X2 [Oryctolagus cuniculus]